MAVKRNRKRRTWIVTTVLVVVVAGAAALFIVNRPAPDPLAGYLTATVTSATVSSNVSASGEIVDELTYSLAPGTTAVVTERDGVAIGGSGTDATATTGSAAGATATGYKTTDLYVAVGDRVDKGDKIVTATSDAESKSDLETAVDNANAALNNAYTALDADQSSLKSEKKSDTSTTQSVNAAKKQVSNDYVAIDSAKADVATAEQNLDDQSVSVKAPADGYVRSITTAVNASASSVATIGAGDQLVSVMVSEYDITRVKTGQTVSISLGATGTDFAGTVARIAQMPDDASGVQKYQVVISSDAIPEGTRLGMTATATIAVAARADVLSVPTSAISTAEDGTSTVSVIDADGLVTATPVTLGLVGDSSVEIASGLTAGETVVTGTNGSIPAVVTRPTEGGAE